MSKNEAPKHLSDAAQTWWRSVVSDYDLEDHHLKLLTLAAESWDRCVQAREAIAKLGLTYQDRFNQPHARPEVAIERDSKISFSRLLRELALDIEEPHSESRPPKINGNSSLKVRQA